jgi:hypothetical protein
MHAVAFNVAYATGMMVHHQVVVGWGVLRSQYSLLHEIIIVVF